MNMARVNLGFNKFDVQFSVNIINKFYMQFYVHVLMQPTHTVVD